MKLKSGKGYVVRLRRQREGKTNYPKRLNLLKSHKTRVIIRRSNKSFTVQFIEFHEKGDKIISHTTSSKLAKKGWKYNPGSLPSAYLIGVIAGKQALSKGIKEAIMDAGLHSSTKGSSIYAVLKGIIDSGVSVPFDKEIIPKDERLKGEHIKLYAEKLSKDDAELYKLLFSGTLKNGLKPENIVDDFEKMKKELLK